MHTFKQYVIDEMGSEFAVGFKSERTGEFNRRKAEKQLKPIMFDADVLLRRKDRLSTETLIQQANELLTKFVDSYENLGDEVTDLKAQIADKYTQVKKLLQKKKPTIEDCVDMLEQVSNLLRG